MRKYVVIGIVVGFVLSSAAIVLAGSLDPPSGPNDAASQMYTLEQIYNRLDTGAVSAKMTAFTEPVAGPGTRTMRTLDEIMAKVPAAKPDPPCFANDHLCWLLNSSAGISCAEIAEMRYHAVQSTAHLESNAA
jgi:hypothetical protein